MSVPGRGRRKVRVSKRGSGSYPWVALCSDVACRSHVHTHPDLGAVAVNCLVGNRTHDLAIAAAVLHLERCHP